MTDIIFSDKRSTDLPDKLSDSEMLHIFEESDVPNLFNYYQSRRKCVIKFVTLLDISGKSFHPNRMHECSHKYYWDGDNYVRNVGWIIWNSDKNCYNVEKPKYLVYISYEDKPDGRKYVGSFTYKKGINDDYLGSFTDKTFKPDEKIILCECETREEAYQKEREIQIALNVVNDPIYANKVICDT
jgi:hypothetical protein